ncbi:MAG: ABC transporter ATP-binding protein [Candidatus Heimdallarchaeota archaeon]|nr:ABC transporter ATP-binding protein [Candidatus Heimdallarchaeota archaeon]
MIKLLKYTKPYLLMILFSIGLLYAQANLDLSLPDYMSDIIDTGIQQGGVENAVPEAIRQSELDKVLIFIDTENQTLVLGNYTIVNENSTDYDSYVSKYPLLVNESLYILNKINRKEKNQLDQILIKPIVITFTFEQALANPENATALFMMIGYNQSLGIDLFTYLQMLPPESLALIVDGITARYEALGTTMLGQIATVAVGIEYELIGMDMDRLQTMYILKAGGLMILMTLLSVICTVAVSFLASRTAAGMARDIRYDLFERVENFSNIEFDTFSTASLITRSTNDVTQVQMVIIMLIRMVFYAPILGIGGIIHALNKNTSMWWLIAVAVGVLLILVLIIFFIAVPKFTKMQTLTDRINLVAREGLAGMMVIRAFNKEKFEEERFDKANVDLTSVSLFLNRLMVILMPFMMLIMNGLSLAIIWIGSHQVADAAMQVGDMLAFLQYSMQIVMAFLMLTMMFIILPRAVVSGKRINEVISTKPIIIDPEEPKTFKEPFKGIIEFRKVNFRYPGAKKDVLHDISFTAEPGKTTGLIGATGSGKTTILNLMLRLYDVSSGSILVDGIDIRKVTQHNLHDKMGYVPQKSSLFSGTIRSNLLFADENATEEDLQSALDIAQATEFVYLNPDKMDSEIAQYGMNVSGGQKQRLSIARSLVKKPPIYVLDDSVSALDFKTDAALRRALKEKTENSTVIIVSQRVSTIKDAEQIIVLDEGKIIGQGTHEELLGACEIYREIAISQLELEGY